ncbi:hypothetical protein BOX15_Mlig007125g1 [Macrostomum lignano]|nr:hypothetical protein BOX15_Mlig007125g1 [Macrostomum lignano]
MGGTSEDLTADLCDKSCKAQNFGFFGLQGNTCWCGSTFGRYGKAAHFMCSTPCPGDMNQKCGGEGINSVYSVSD